MADEGLDQEAEPAKPDVVATPELADKRAAVYLAHWFHSEIVRWGHGHPYASRYRWQLARLLARYPDALELDADTLTV